MRALRTLCTIAGLLAAGPGCGADPADALAGACAARELPGGSSSETGGSETGSGAEAPDEMAAAGILFTVASGLNASASTADFTLQGTTEHLYGFAIRRLQIGGVDATSTGPNFSQWTVTLKLAALRSRPYDAAGRVNLEVRATDACGSHAGEPLALVLDVPTFALAVAYPQVDEVEEMAEGETEYLPTDGKTAAVLKISASDENAAGMRIRVGAQPSDGVVLDGLFGDSVTLAAVDGGAKAEVRVRATKGGQYTLQARSASALQSVTLVVAGPPTFVPMNLTVVPGDVREVVVLSDGRLRECWATTSVAGLAVTLDGSDLVKAPAMSDADVHAWTVRIAADEMIDAGGAATIACRDSYLQTGTLEITVGD